MWQASARQPISYGDAPTTDEARRRGYAIPYSGQVEESHSPAHDGILVSPPYSTVPGAWLYGEFALAAPINEGDSLTATVDFAAPARRERVTFEIACRGGKIPAGVLEPIWKYNDRPNNLSEETATRDLLKCVSATVIRLTVVAAESKTGAAAVWARVTIHRTPLQ